jgi:hypothetical protein
MREGKRWDGDTECYWLNQKEPIIASIKDHLSSPAQTDYRRELELYEIPNFFPRDVSRPKDETNKPIAVVAVDPSTNKVVERFASLADAGRAGFGNLSALIADENTHRTAAGLRWFKAAAVNEASVPPVTKVRPGRIVRCLDTGEQFPSIIAAVAHFRAKAVTISSAHISSACSGNRKTAGRMRWSYGSSFREG